MVVGEAPGKGSPSNAHCGSKDFLDHARATGRLRTSSPQQAALGGINAGRRRSPPLRAAYGSWF